MTLSRERRLINGVWTSLTVDETGGGGGSQSLEAVRVPIAFDTPNLVVQEFAITNADTGTQVVTIAGSHASKFPVGRWAGIVGSSEADSTYTVASVTEVGGNTEVELLAALSGTFDAARLLNVGTAGVTVPVAAGDRVSQEVSVSVTTAFDGTAPAVYTWAGVTSAGNAGWINPFDLTTADAEISSGLWLYTDQANTAPATFIYPPADDSLVFFIGGSSYEDPVMTQGEGEIILQILRAA